VSFRADGGLRAGGIIARNACNAQFFRAGPGSGMTLPVGTRTPWHETVTVRGLRHRLTWWGERSATPVVLLHGWLDTGDTWQFLVDKLPAGWSCVAPDWRGFGGTEWPQDGYWFADYLADLDALLDLLCPAEPAWLIAHSMGGNVASMYAGIRPKRVRWLANLEGIGLKRSVPEDAPTRYTEWLDQLKDPTRQRRYSSIESVVNFLVTRNPRMSRERALFIARAWTKPDGDGVAMSFDPRHRNVSAMMFRREEAEACWRRIEAPVLLFLGETSDIRPRISPDGSDAYFHSLYRDLRIVELPGVGHMMHLEDPDSVARHLIDFAASR
jgi:pimeloyl-ACP methyl ester carboxylesterase